MITIENVKPIENIGPREPMPVMQLVLWHNSAEELPSELPDFVYEDPGPEKRYLCQTHYGHIVECTWCNGWNNHYSYSCSGGVSVWMATHASIERHDIVAWAELEVPFPEEVIV